MSTTKKLACPECGRTLAVDAGQLGGFVGCPHCDANFLALPGAVVGDAAEKPQAARADAEGSAAAVQAPAAPAGDDAAPKFKGLPAQAATRTASPEPAPARPSPQRPTKPPPAARRSDRPAVPARKTAKFIANSAEVHAVPLPKEGHLPQLSLAADQDRPSQEVAVEPTSEGNPAVALGAVAISVALSLLVWFFDAGDERARPVDAAAARAELVRFYGEADKPLKPYQQDLRQAALAHARGDTAEERALYRRVLRQLRAEDRSGLTGLTGGPKSDDDLERLLGLALRDRG